MLAAMFYGLCGLIGATLEFCGLKCGTTLSRWSAERLDPLDEEDLR